MNIARDIPQGSALGLVCMYMSMTYVPLQVQHGCLLQFANDTCLICSEDTG